MQFPALQLQRQRGLMGHRGRLLVLFVFFSTEHFNFNANTRLTQPQNQAA
jgi:hypothetical protein